MRPPPGLAAADREARARAEDEVARLRGEIQAAEEALGCLRRALAAAERTRDEAGLAYILRALADEDRRLLLDASTLYRADTSEARRLVRLGLAVRRVSEATWATPGARYYERTPLGRAVAALLEPT